MKPTVISNVNACASTESDNFQAGRNGVSIPINHEYREQPVGQNQEQPQFNTQAQHYVTNEVPVTSYGSPGSHGRAQRPHPKNRQHQQEIPAHFQQHFDFEPDVDIEMFPRTRLGRMTHDPFGDFGGTTPDFGFPQFSSLGRRRINSYNDDDFFNRLPSEFRQYIPESFGHRRAGSGIAASQNSGPAMVHTQQSSQQHPQTHFYNTIPQSPRRKVCDAAIQTEDPTGRSEIDHSLNTENLSQHGFRNTIDMGVKSPSENEIQSPRSSSAPPAEQQQNQQQHFYTQPQHIPVNGSKCQTPSPQQHQFATQTSPQIPSSGYLSQSPRFQKVSYAPQQQTHPQQKQETAPPKTSKPLQQQQPQTPAGSTIRTIPIFVEGRSEPIINNKEIPNQNSAPNVSHGSGNSSAFTPPKQQTHRLTPLNTQQQPTAQSGGTLPQTPHTVDTINKIQDIQRDVLELMSRVEKFTGTRADKEYVYLDEMLTRNLLKLDNIDTNGKDSIRLARKEAIKCIQASINVLEAKAEENKKAAKSNIEASKEPVQEPSAEMATSLVPAPETLKSTVVEEMAKELTTTVKPIVESADSKNNEPIPLPPPKNEKFNEVKIEDCPEDDVPTSCITESLPIVESTLKKASSEAK